MGASILEIRGQGLIELGGQGLIELEVLTGLGVSGIEAGCLIEQEVALRRVTRGGDGRGPMGQVEVEEDGGVGRARSRPLRRVGSEGCGSHEPLGPSRHGRACGALRYWRAAEARGVVEAWEESGETLAGFARRYGIHRRRLGRWVEQLAPEEGEGGGWL